MAHPTPDAVALVALGEDVDAQTREHLAECRPCSAEVEDLQQVVAVGRSLGADDRLTTPHPRVWQRIEAALSGGRVIPLPGAVDRPVSSLDGTGTPAGTNVLAGRRRPARARRRWASTALAAAAALVVGLGGGFVLKGSLDSGLRASTTQLNALPQWPGANGTATVDEGRDGERTLVVTMELPPTLPVDGRLEVWMSDTRAVDMTPMGTMTGSTGRFPIPEGTDLTSHPIVDVSLEPPGDADPAHSDTSVVRGRLRV